MQLASFPRPDIVSAQTYSIPQLKRRVFGLQVVRFASVAQALRRGTSLLCQLTGHRMLACLPFLISSGYR